MAMRSAGSSVCANRSRIHSRVVTSPLIAAHVAGGRVDQDLARPQLEAGEVDLGGRAVAQLEVERRLGDVDRRGARLRLIAGVDRRGQVVERPVHLGREPGRHLAAAGRPPRRRSTRLERRPRPTSSPRTGRRRRRRRRPPTAPRARRAHDRRARRSARRGPAPRRRRRGPSRTRRSRARTPCRCSVPSRCSSRPTIAPSTGPVRAVDGLVDGLDLDLLERDAGDVLGPVHVADLGIARHDHRRRAVTPASQVPSVLSMKPSSL